MYWAIFWLIIGTGALGNAVFARAKGEIGAGISLMVAAALIPIGIVHILAQVTS